MAGLYTDTISNEAGTTTYLSSGTLDNVALGSSVTGKGKIVSFAHAISSTSDISTTSTSYVEASSQLRVALTPTSPNVIFMFLCGGSPRLGDGGAMYVTWGIVNPGDDSLTTDNIAISGGTTSAQGLAEWQGTDHHGGTHSEGWLYTPASYGSLITFTPTFRGSTSDSNYFTEGIAHQKMVTYAFEIRQ